MKGQFVPQMAGYPGSGKTTVARGIKAATGAVLLDKDVIKSAMLTAGLSGEVAAPLAYDVFFAVGRALAEAGDSVILDSPAYYPAIPQTGKAIAADTGARYLIIECICRDEGELMRRLTARERMPSQMAHITDPYSLPGTAPLTVPHLVLETDTDRDDYIKRALEYVSS